MSAEMEEFRKNLVKFRMPSVPSVDNVVFQWWEEGQEDTIEVVKPHNCSCCNF